jgi:hypothetical protein
MKAIRLSRTLLCGLLGGSALSLAFSLSAAAQVQTKQTETPGQAARAVKVERGEVVYVSGNNLVVKMEDGTLRHFDNVPERTACDETNQRPSTLAWHEIEKQTITTTTPKTITTIKPSLAPWYVSPPNSVILRMSRRTSSSRSLPEIHRRWTSKDAFSGKE